MRDFVGSGGSALTEEEKIRQLLNISPEEEQQALDMVTGMGMPAMGVVDGATKAARRSAWSRLSLDGLKFKEIKDAGAEAFESMMNRIRKSFRDNKVAKNPEWKAAYDAAQPTTEIPWEIPGIADVVDMQGKVVRKGSPAQDVVQEVIDTTKPENLYAVEQFTSPEIIHGWKELAGNEAKNYADIARNSQTKTRYPWNKELIDFPTGKRKPMPYNEPRLTVPEYLNQQAAHMKNLRNAIDHAQNRLSIMKGELNQKGLTSWEREDIMKEIRTLEYVIQESGAELDDLVKRRGSR